MSDTFRRKYVDVEARQFDGTKEGQDALIAWVDGKTAGKATHLNVKGSWNDEHPEPGIVLDNSAPDGAIETLIGTDWLVVTEGRLERYINDRFVSLFDRLEQ